MGLKELFIKEEPQQEQNTAPVTPKEVAPTTDNIMPVSVPPVVQGATPANSGIVDEETVRKLWDMIIQKNLPGPDYLEFKNNMAGLVEITPDENMQMKGAFNVIKRSYPEFSKDIIMNSIDTYVTIINEEKDKGLKELDAIRQKNVGDKLETIANKKSSAEEILRQIDDLKKRYESLNSEIVKLEGEVATATNDIKVKENTFINSVQRVIDTLNADKAKVSALNLA